MLSSRCGEGTVYFLPGNLGLPGTAVPEQESLDPACDLVDISP